MSASRQTWLQSQASSELASGGMRGLYRWYSDLAPADRALIEHFIIQPGSIPVDAEPEPEDTEAEIDQEETPEMEDEPELFDICPYDNCGAEQLIKSRFCFSCQRDMREA